MVGHVQNVLGMCDNVKNLSNLKVMSSVLILKYVDLEERISLF
jgi:hypothetical protein